MLEVAVERHTMEEKIASLEKKKRSEGENKEEEDVVLPGFRFHPTDEELVGFYLRRKVENKLTAIEIIKEIDIYKYDPWDLPRLGSIGGEKEWYFFCLRGRKYRNSVRPNRVTGSGFWKATGIDKPIYSSASDADGCIGLKKSLVYHRGSAGKGNKTDWMMHEFRLPPNGKDRDQTRSPNMQEAEIWTICRILQRNSSSKKYTRSVQKETPTDSDSKTGFQFDTGEYYQSNKLISNNIEDQNQIYGGDQWNPTLLQASLVNNCIAPTDPNFTYAFLTKETGNWDELGKMMDYCMMDQSASQDIRYDL